MDFISKHYEKLLLVFCLLCLFFGIITVSMSTGKIREQLKSSLDKANRDVSKGELVEKMAATDYHADKFLNDPRKTLSFLGSPQNPTPKGSLIEPNKLIKCVSEKCDYLISLQAEVCPFCGEKQPELAAESAIGADTDSDGLPDEFEMKYDFLNYRNPLDARMDADNDGFLNIEEFKANTKIDDPDDFPPLGILLRTGKVFRQNIPLKLVDIDKNRSEDVKKWDVVVMYYDIKTRKMKRGMCQVGDTIGNYKILQAGFTGEGNMAVPFAMAAPKDDEADVYRLEQNKETPSKKLTVQILYLANRMRQNAPYILRRFVMVKNVGDEFQLVKEKRTSRQVETYRLLEADEKDSSVKVALLKEAKGAVDKTFQLERFNAALDFIDNNMMRGMDGGMDGGAMEGVPGRPQGGVRGPRR